MAFILTSMDTQNAIERDRELIRALGGPAKVARLLKFNTKSGGIQRVQNWMARGIPAKVKVDFPQIFMRPAKQKREAA